MHIVFLTIIKKLTDYSNIVKNINISVFGAIVLFCDCIKL